jgi:hypothetical protein
VKHNIFVLVASILTIAASDAFAGPTGPTGPSCNCTFIFAKNIKETRSVACPTGHRCTTEKKFEGDKYNPTCRCVSSMITSRRFLRAECHTKDDFSEASRPNVAPMRTEKACANPTPAGPAR